MRRAVSALAAALFLGGCYHVTVETGLRPGTQTVENKWAASWIAGLVPPKTVETMERCPGGVARVETKLSFLNQLVSGLTGGIFTPMDIRVTCAAAEEEEQQVTSAEGFRAAVEKGGAFVVRVQ